MTAVDAAVTAPPAATTRTMRAATVAAPGEMGIEHLEIPETGPGQVRIRLEGSGLCGSNLPVWEGRPWLQYPGEPGSPGHEGWGLIDAVAEGVTTVKPGDRVAALSYHAFAEYDLADAGGVVVLPQSLAGRAFPGEPLGCAFNAFHRSEILPGHTIAIIGIGFLGAVLTRLASQAGARVIAISRRPFALELARELGAEAALQLEDPRRVVQEVNRITGGAGVDRSIEVVGLQGPLDLAAELTRVRGRLVIAGYHQDGLRQVNMQLWNWRGLDVINAHEREPAMYVEGMRRAVEAVSSGVLDPAPLYTHTFPLERLDAAFEIMRQRPDGFLKALVVT